MVLFGMRHEKRRKVLPGVRCKTSGENDGALRKLRLGETTIPKRRRGFVRIAARRCETNIKKRRIDEIRLFWLVGDYVSRKSENCQFSAKGRRTNVPQYSHLPDDPVSGAPQLGQLNVRTSSASRARSRLRQKS